MQLPSKVPKSDALSFSQRSTETDTLASVGASVCRVSSVHVQPETIPCDEASYQFKFPKPKMKLGNFQHHLNDDNELTLLLENASVAGSVYNYDEAKSTRIKKGHETPAFVNLWKKKVSALSAHQFNGKQLSVYFTLREPGERPQLKLCANDFVTVSLARSRATENRESLTLREHYNCGVVLAYLTKDNQIVYSSKNDHCLFPGGFILGGEAQTSNEDIDAALKPIKEKKSTFTQLIKETAIRESNEEILDSEQDIDEVKILGWAGEQFTYPSKQDTNKKEVFCVKSICVLIKSKLTSTELIKRREEVAPVDHEELGALHFLNVEELKNNSKFAEKFILEHANCYQILVETNLS